MLVFLIAALTCFASLTRLHHITDSDTRQGLWALLLTSGGWAAAHVGFLVSPTTSLKLGWYTLGLVLGLAAVGAWLYFCSAYTGRTYHRNPTYRRLAIAVYIALVAVKVTNPSTANTSQQQSSLPRSLIYPYIRGHYTGPRWGSRTRSPLSVTSCSWNCSRKSTLTHGHSLLSLGSLAFPSCWILLGTPRPTSSTSPTSRWGRRLRCWCRIVYIDQFEAVQLAAERDTPVIALDVDNYIRDTNRAALTLFPEIDGAEGAHLETSLPQVADCLDSDNPILKVQQEGSTRYYRVTETPYGTVKSGLGRTIVLTDVTDRERYREELERQNERLEQFASLVSHDLRNPLNVATGRFELLREEVVMAADNENAEAVERALTRMDDLINQILTLAREGQPVEQWDAVSLSSVAKGSWEMVETDTAELRVDDDLAFKADPARLKRLFENLFRNALDHGGPDVTVTVGALSDKPGFYVFDDGPGIPEGDGDSVFEPGYTTREEGTGFGLAIVAEMVTAHGWTIQVTESETGGARFEILGVESVA